MPEEYVSQAMDNEYESQPMDDDLGDDMVGGPLLQHCGEGQPGMAHLQLPLAAATPTLFLVGGAQSVAEARAQGCFLDFFDLPAEGTAMLQPSLLLEGCGQNPRAARRAHSVFRLQPVDDGTTSLQVRDIRQDKRQAVPSELPKEYRSRIHRAVGGSAYVPVSGSEWTELYDGDTITFAPYLTASKMPNKVYCYCVSLPKPVEVSNPVVQQEEAEVYMATLAIPSHFVRPIIGTEGRIKRYLERQYSSTIIVASLNSFVPGLEQWEARHVIVTTDREDDLHSVISEIITRISILPTPGLFVLLSEDALARVQGRDGGGLAQIATQQSVDLGEPLHLRRLSETDFEVAIHCGKGTVDTTSAAISQIIRLSGEGTSYVAEAEDDASDPGDESEDEDEDIESSQDQDRASSSRIRNANHVRSDPSLPVHVQKRRQKQRQKKASDKGTQSAYNKAMKKAFAGIRKLRTDFGRSPGGHSKSKNKQANKKKKKKK